MTKNGVCANSCTQISIYGSECGQVPCHNSAYVPWFHVREEECQPEQPCLWWRISRSYECILICLAPLTSAHCDKDFFFKLYAISHKMCKM